MIPAPTSGPLYVVSCDHPDTGYTVEAVCTSPERAHAIVERSMRACDQWPIANTQTYDDTLTVIEGTWDAFWHITVIPLLDQEPTR